LLSRALNAGCGSQASFGKTWLGDALWQAEDAPLNLWGEAQERHDLADPGAGETFAAGDGGLAFDLAGVKLALPSLGEAQEPGGAGGPRVLRRRGIP